jgi:hypothetical protein
MTSHFSGLIPLTHKYMTSHFPGLVQDLIKSGRVKLVLWVKIFSLNGSMQSCKYFLHVSKMPLHTSGNRSSDRNKHYKRSENKLIVCYVDIGGIVDHHCLDFLYCNVVDHH